MTASNLIQLARLDVAGLRELVFVDPETGRVSFPHAGAPAAMQIVHQIDDLESVLDQLAAAPLLGMEP